MSTVSRSLRSAEAAVGAMRNIHQMLVSRFVDMHGASACDMLLQESSRLRQEIVSEIQSRLQPVSSDTGVEETSVVEYDPDDLELVEVRDDFGAPTGEKRPKLFAPPLATALVERITLERVNHRLEGQPCSICQESYFYGQRVLVFPVCAHEFCQDCAYQWLSICGSCPSCRRVISDRDFDTIDLVPQSSPMSPPEVAPPDVGDVVDDAPQRGVETVADVSAVIPPQRAVLCGRLRPSSSPSVRVPPPSSLQAAPQVFARPSSASQSLRPTSSSLREQLSRAPALEAKTQSLAAPVAKAPSHIGTPFNVFNAPHRCGSAGITLRSGCGMTRPASAPVTNVRRAVELAPSAQRILLQTAIEPPKDSTWQQKRSPAPQTLRGQSAANEVLVAASVRCEMSVRPLSCKPRSAAGEAEDWARPSRQRRPLLLPSRNRSGVAADECSVQPLFIGGTSLSKRAPPPSRCTF